MRNLTLTIERRPVPLGAGTYVDRWFVFREGISGKRALVEMFEKREHAEQWVASFEKQWESKDE